MGAALKYLREFLEKISLELDRRTAASLLILLLLLILLPIGLFLIRDQLTFVPRAAGELIQLGDGGCIKLAKNKKKVVDCPLIPLKLVNPFFSVTGSSAAPSTGQVSPTPGFSVPASLQPSPSPSQAGAAQVIRVNGNTSTQIQAALDQIKDSGGAVYLPAGTYAINKKIQVYSNVTLFGDGIDLTILDAGIEIDEEEAVVGNDTTAGQRNVGIRDMTIRGHELGSSEAIKLRNLDGGFIYNVKAERVNTGILLGFHTGKGVNNFRVSNCQIFQTKLYGVFLSLGENNVIDRCTIDSGGSDTLGIGMEIAVEGKISGNRVISNSVSNGGHSYTFTSGNDTQSDPAWINSNNIVCYNTANGNNIQPIWDQRGSGNVYVGNNVAVNNVGSNGFEEKSGTDPRCDIPAFYNIPAVPTKPAADNSSWIDRLIGNVFAQDSDDIFTSASASLNPSPTPAASTGSQVLRYRLAETQAGLEQAQLKEFALVPVKNNSSFGWIFSLVGNVFAQDSDDNFTGTSGNDSNDQFVTASGGPVSTGSPAFSIGKQSITVDYQLKDTKPGAKQVWVQYIHPNGAIRVDHVTFDLVDKVPQILGLSCNLDVSKQNLKITVKGNYFGNAIGTATTVDPAAKIEVLGWNNTEVSGIIKKPSIPINEGQRFRVKVVRPDGFESGVAVCAVDKSLVSLGAKIFCREPGKFDATDVAVTLFYNPETTAGSSAASKVEEKATIDKDGEINQLKTQLQVGKNYTISIKAPGSLRRNATFTALDGTTQITRPDGEPFILPVGDIAPKINPDGQINTLDRSELIRQWRILGTQSDKQSGDFNRDSKVNSIDWACMQYDFGSSDDPVPIDVFNPASNTIKIPEPASGTITIPVISPSPRPSVTSDKSVTINIGFLNS